MPVIAIVATARAKKGSEESLKKALLELVEPTHRESGCLVYDLHQSVDDKGLFMFFENWQSRDALDKHFASAHFKAFEAKAKDLIDGAPEIRTFARIG